MKTYYIPEFQKDEFIFCGAHTFASNRTLLLSNSGTSIILSNKLAESITKENISEELAFKLYQRGFGSVYGQERLKDDNIDELSPTFFMIDFTTKCNLNCIYCLRHFENEGEVITDDVLTDICNYIIEYCKIHDIRRISFQPWGGEPLIAIQMILHSKELFDKAGICTNCTIQTNGVLLTTKNYKLLKEHGIDIGISIDGIKAAHNAHRMDIKGNETYDLLLKRIRDIQDYDPEAELCTISVNSEFTLPYINESIQTFVNDLKIKYLKHNLVHPNGETFDRSLLITEEKIPQYIQKVFESVIRELRENRYCSEANIQSRLINIINGIDTNICHSKGCRGGIELISFSRTGDIYPCELIGISDVKIGNIYDGIDLCDLIKTATASNSYFTKKESEVCHSCPYQYYCRGGCRASTLAYGKAPYEIDHIECAVNKALYPKIIELLLDEPQIAERLLNGRVQLT